MDSYTRRPQVKRGPLCGTDSAVDRRNGVSQHLRRTQCLHFHLLILHSSFKVRQYYMSKTSKRQQRSIAMSWVLHGISAMKHTRLCGATTPRFILCEMIDVQAAELIARGAAIASGPTDQPYGIRELAIRDVNGVGVVFGQDIGHD